MNRTGVFGKISCGIRRWFALGLEAARQIRTLKREDALQIPIIAMSANAFQDDIESSLAAGMNDHVMKPLEPDKVDAAIQKVLRQSGKAGQK